MDELKQLQSTWAYAYAHGAGCTIGPVDPRLQHVLDRETILLERLNRPPKVMHAYEEGSLTALCGRAPGKHTPKGDSIRCPDCLHAASRGNWTNRG